MKSAYLAGGCFWCITPSFELKDGVIRVISGYSGGIEKNPTYEEVKKQLTSHRETIKIDYDENIVSFEELIRLFLGVVDPFDGGGQFIDRGHSYTLAVYYNDEEELKVTNKLILEFEKINNKKTFIAVEKFKSFYVAEEYHQDYYKKNPLEFEEELVKSGRKKL